MRRVGTGETHVGEIPLNLFQYDKFDRQLYLDEAARIALKGVDALKVSKTEPIHICTGYILSKASKELRRKGFNLSNRRIVGETQDLAEREFVKSLIRLGVGEEDVVSGMRSFKSLLAWVRQDLHRRECFVKTGWKSWTKYRKEGTHIEP